MQNLLSGVDFVQTVVIDGDQGVDIDGDDRWFVDCMMMRYGMVLHDNRYGYFMT